MKIISFSGKIASGKDTGFFLLKEHYEKQGLKCRRLSVADPIKDVLASLLGWDRELLGHDFDYKEGNLTEDGKIDPACERFGMTRRQVMQRWGTDAIRDNFHPDFWIFVLERAINAGRFHGTDIGFITDARFLNELEFVRKMNGLTIRIDRMNLGGEKVESNGKSHSSESKWMEWTDWDRVAENVVDSSKSQEYNMERFLLELTRHIDPFVLAS